MIDISQSRITGLISGRICPDLYRISAHAKKSVMQRIDAAQGNLAPLPSAH
jgi:hypothetical protein